MPTVYVGEPFTFQLGLSGFRTGGLGPLNGVRLAFLASGIRAAGPSSVPVLLLPEESVVVEPADSLKPYAATIPWVADAVVNVKSDETAAFPAASLECAL